MLFFDSVSKVALDRLSVYFSLIQIVTLTRLINYFKGPVIKFYLISAVTIFYFVYMITWLSFGNNKSSYTYDINFIPVNSWLQTKHLVELASIKTGLNETEILNVLRGNEIDLYLFYK